MISILQFAICIFPVYYIWRIYVASTRKSAHTPWLPSILLVLWIAQFPAMGYLIIAAGQYCEDCSTRPITPVDLLFYTGWVAYNVIPGLWLWRRAARDPPPA
jgi:hypothetical protein